MKKTKIPVHQKILTTVQCNGCTVCCKGDAIFIHPDEGDDPEKYQTVEQVNPVTGEKALMLDHKENGDCVYLTEEGCGIYLDRPVICKSFDCRKQYLMMTKAMRARLNSNGMMGQDMFKEGKKRVRTLSAYEKNRCIQVRNSRVRIAIKQRDS